MIDNVRQSVPRRNYHTAINVGVGGTPDTTPIVPNCNPVGHIHDWYLTGIKGPHAELEVCRRCGRVRAVMDKQYQGIELGHFVTIKEM
jgi:hypothetical protein